MKTLKRLFLGLVILLITASILAIVTGNTHLFKGIAYTYLKGNLGPTIDEHQLLKVEPLRQEPMSLGN